MYQLLKLKSINFYFTIEEYETLKVYDVIVDACDLINIVSSFCYTNLRDYKQLSSYSMNYNMKKKDFPQPRQRNEKENPKEQDGLTLL